MPIRAKNRDPAALHATEVLPPREGIKALSSLELKARKTLVNNSVEDNSKEQSCACSPDVLAVLCGPTKQSSRMSDEGELIIIK